MTKKQAADTETGKLPEGTGTVQVRKGLYRGQNNRAFQSVPFGETMVCRAGLVYEVRESFAYLWQDEQFAALFEWQGEMEGVPAVNPGQVPPPA